ncbi:hypothetical protein [Peribacillus frigoritolerans]|uniref:hypothetical protein n=1 Tax=Peribacillus frigoritolerans TaxID=450367 RepID=UPI0031D93420
MKKFATLLPKNWLAENPQALAPRRLGRQSAVRERISEIDWMFLNKKLQSNSFLRVYIQSETSHPACFILQLKRVRNGLISNHDFKTRPDYP